MKTKTYYHLVLDRSGSMETCWEETMNALTQEITRVEQLRTKHPDQEIYLSVCVFNENVHLPLKASTNPYPDMSWTSLATPNGSTALYDAVGDAIAYLKKEEPCWKENNSNFVVIVLTDGHENASRRHFAQPLAKHMSELKETGNWTFAFIGADFDIKATADKFGIEDKDRLNCSKSDMNFTFNEINEMLDDMILTKKLGLQKKGFFDKRKR